MPFRFFFAPSDTGQSLLVKILTLYKLYAVPARICGASEDMQYKWGTISRFGKGGHYSKILLNETSLLLTCQLIITVY